MEIVSHTKGSLNPNRGPGMVDNEVYFDGQSAGQIHMGKKHQE